MRIEIKWHRENLIIGDGRNEQYLDAVLKEISKQDEKNRLKENSK